MNRDVNRAVRVAVVGAGEWGKNHVRTFAHLRGATLASVCDLDSAKLEAVRSDYPGVAATARYDDVLRDSSIEGVVIASFASKHFEQARLALAAKKHVLVEKPMTLAPEEAEELVHVADQTGCCLMVGHLLLYHPAVAKMKALVANQEIGDLFYLYSQRLNLGRVRKDENALWSFGPHDVAVAVYLFGDEPEVVTAKGEAFLQQGVVDVVFVTLHFPRRKLAHIHLSWLDPHKTRRTTIVGSKKMVVFDDMEPTDKVRIYDKGVDIKPQAVAYEDYLHVRFGDVLIPHIGSIEPLRLECQHFLDCIRTGARPMSDGRQGLQVIRILAAAQRSLDLDGAPVPVKG
ncbi:MAG: Gfo/Idh/MocA family oxidoreductase [Nitrospirota bacterium]|nr:Gfo/Idh/MocA family oxidoreductase [Nitrospirota bacterium]MDE3224071.1 Gfo/Idh/MocA family oxidoreductase [Nitrospirota bacterium]MDE3241894.1 Gfo/Idh/MocA family oxidoreductase [Nitrospirota bacterium]